MRKILLLWLFLFSAAIGMQAADGKENTEQKPRSTSKFVKWISKNWSAKDPKYCYDTFYNWAAQVEDVVSQEFITIATPEGFNINLHSNISNKIGPHFGYRWISFGHSFDFLAKSDGKKHSEFTLKINSQLFNIDIIKLNKTGGFNLGSFKFQDNDLMSFVDSKKINKGINYDLFSTNINLFLNHKRFSNPAAYSNGAIQVRSAVSPVVGFGFGRQKVNTEFMHNMVGDILPQITTESNVDEAGFEENFHQARIPDEITAYDIHAQLGLALNIVLSKHLLLSSTAIASPAAKLTSIKTEGPLTFDNDGFLEENTKSPKTNTFFNANTNVFGRASITYNKEHWRVGAAFKYNRYVMSKNADSEAPTIFNSSYYDLSLYVGYCFGRKKAFREGGEKHYQYQHVTY